ncbi:hypothetical protein LUZ60_006317 [Juncus effusus]|nr:hypothetical protein LUZ60_006317 [Juncus effusus]
MDSWRMKKSSKDKKKLQTSISGPKLDRRNANKNIGYEADHSGPLASWSSSSPRSSEFSTIRATKSLDISPEGYSGQTSFRIGGSIEGEVDKLYESLGVSGPEDFAVSIKDWEDQKARSRSVQLDAQLVEKSDPVVEPVDSGELRETQLLELPEIEERPAQLDDLSRNEEEKEAIHHHSNEESMEVTTFSPRKGNGNGIKGVRPPILSPPTPFLSPQPLLPLAPPPLLRPPSETRHTIGSTWDLISSFAPNESELDGREERRRFYDSEEEKEDLEFEDLRLGEVSEGFSPVSTLNDDDASSSTTETIFTVSPNGILRRKIKSWVKGNQLGSGSFGTVYEAISDEGIFFAIKEVSLLDQGSNAQQCITQLEHEIALLSQFQHENIVQYYGTEKGENKLYIFIELVTQGSLASLYQKYNLRDTHVSAYTRQILSGLVYLHQRNIVHRDIKCANILVHANGSVKLADFGLAKEMNKINELKSTKGSVYWMAPEVANRRNKADGYGSAADIWSLGCTVLEMLTRQIPYPNLEWIHALFKIGRGEPPTIPENLSSEARDFISQCVRVSPEERPTAVQLLDHPFVKRSLSFKSPSPVSNSSPVSRS